MVDHQAREHARWAASSTEANWNCSGRLALIEQIVTPEKENPAAAWGTACHQVSEKCLRNGKDAVEFIGTVEKTKEHEIDVDEELAATAQTYIDYVRGRLAKYKAETGDDAVVHYEQHFSLADIKPPIEAGGTGDTVMYFPKWRLLEVVDLKGGRGVVVEVKGNKQARTYGLGSMLVNTGHDIEKVTSTIVQPRAGHKDGIIRSETIHVADLMEWTADLLEAMHRCVQASADFDKIGKTVTRVEWDKTHLAAGDHCKFCRAAGTCPALEQRATDAAGIWFDDLDQAQIGKSNAPTIMDVEKLSKTLDSFDMIQEWMAAVRAHANEQAQLGVAIPNYQLVDSIGHRKFTDEEKVKELLFLKLDLTDDDLHEKKFKSPAKIEKVLGAKKLKTVKADLDALITRPVSGTNLVRTTKTTRAAAAPAVSKHFSPIPD